MAIWADGVDHVGKNAAQRLCVPSCHLDTKKGVSIRGGTLL